MGGCGSDGPLLPAPERPPQCLGHPLGHVSLEPEDVRHYTLIWFSPDMGAIGDLDELGCDTQLLATRAGGRTYGAVEHVLHSQRPSELRGGLARPRVLEGAAPGDEAQTWH